MGIFDFLKKNKNIISENGLNEIYFNNGKGRIKERYYKQDGVLHGSYESYKIKINYKGDKKVHFLDFKGEYKNGQKHGTFISYLRDTGKIDKKEVFKNGESITEKNRKAKQKKLAKQRQEDKKKVDDQYKRDLQDQYSPLMIRKTLNEKLKSRYNAEICLISTDDIIEKLANIFISEVEGYKTELIDFLNYKREYILFKTLKSDISIYNKKEGTISFQDDFDIEFEKDLDADITNNEYAKNKVRLAISNGDINIEEYRYRLSLLGEVSNDDIIHFSRTSWQPGIDRDERISKFDKTIKDNIDYFIGLTQVSYRRINKFYYKISEAMTSSEWALEHINLNYNHLEEFQKSFKDLSENLERLSDDDVNKKFEIVGISGIFQDKESSTDDKAINDLLEREQNLVDEVKAQAKELFKDEYCRGQIVYARISYATIEDYDNLEIPEDMLELKNFTDDAGNVIDDKLKSLEKHCQVNFDVHRNDNSKLLDASKFTNGLAKAFFLTNAYFDSTEDFPVISCVAVFFLPLAPGVDEITHEMSQDLVEYFEEGFELFLSIEGDYSIPPAEKYSYNLGEVLEFTAEKQST